MGKLVGFDESVEHDYSESILDTCARVSSLSTFRLLQARDARRSQRRRGSIDA